MTSPSPMPGIPRLAKASRTRYGSANPLGREVAIPPMCLRNRRDYPPLVGKV